MQAFHKHGLPSVVGREPALRACFEHVHAQLLCGVRNVVLGGGGMNGLMYIGALMALSLHSDAVYTEWRANVRAIAGTSAGALIGAMIAARLTPDAMRELVHSSDLGAVLRSAVDLPLHTMLARRAVSSGASTDAALAAFVARLCGGNAAATLADFAAATGVTLHITVTNLRTGVAEFWSAANKPHVQLAHALRCSVAVPGMLPPFAVDGCTYVDGGVTCNIPVHLFAPFETAGNNQNKTLVLLTYGTAPDVSAAPPLATAAGIVFMALNAAQLAPLRMAPQLLFTTIVCCAAESSGSSVAPSLSSSSVSSSTSSKSASTSVSVSVSGAASEAEATSATPSAPPAALAAAAGFGGLSFSADPAALDAMMERGTLAVVAWHFVMLLLLCLIMAILFCRHITRA